MNDVIRTSNERLTDQELTYQLIRLETRADLSLGDLPAAQVLRDAARRIELKTRALRMAASEIERYVDFQQKHDYREYAAETQKKLDAINVMISGESSHETSDVQALLTVQQDNKRLRAALAAIEVGTPDLLPPYRAMEARQLQEIAAKALRRPAQKADEPRQSKIDPHCEGCGAPEVAGLTLHKPGCTAENGSEGS